MIPRLLLLLSRRKWPPSDKAVKTIFLFIDRIPASELYE